MRKIERILMPTDFSECADRALTHAIYLAKQFQAELHLLNVIVLHDEDPAMAQFPDHDALFQRLGEISASKMRDRLGAYASSPLQIVEHRKRGTASAPEIAAFAEEQGIDLIVMGAHGRRGWRRFLLGSVAEEVVRTAPCPVLTLRDQGEDPALQEVGDIVVPVDLSEPSRQTLTAAKELAAIYGARIHLVHVVAAPFYPTFYSGFAGAFDYSFPNLAVQLSEALTDWYTTTDGPTIDFDVKILEGQPAQEITEYAQKTGAGLIVLATHGTTGWEHALLGSVSEKVVRMADCPVLTLRFANQEDADATRQAESVGASS